ncbi:NapC/NirT family cytochrome c [Labilibaculum euxinus]|uniref:SUMF1/EgtB/PvdO family nonheme iron enzyme n=1 Tax=Labilibaculum euxinus TaxID=2686357 RepID=A0A7M4D3R9_9BACT|nr:NapC/NirT family cytochrome c [Labilibaculum euxinus]MUP37298.1 SUMF1/EgtB/PvdO family nonheme iron enzyme [Labilibaculum euxinus]MVB06503.1 SUMF1/EgtB/PvdO family nonheme iron enzyme [Labilibaculum euxinus]
MNKSLHKRKFLLFILSSFLFALVFVTGLKGIDHLSSSDEYCMSCHVHSHTDNEWRISSHHNNKSGVIVHCADCHLPPKEHMAYWPEKIKAGSRDLYSYWCKDMDKINWDEKSTLEKAKHHTFTESCIRCHQNSFPLHLSKKGDEAHFYYKNNSVNLDCINCHLGVGHGEKELLHENINFLKSSQTEIKYHQAAEVKHFINFTEKIPGTSVAFEMIAIPATAKMSKSFFMAKTEVSWNEYQSFLNETESEGRTKTNTDIDAISGATPPFGDPSQGWGMGNRPAITMTWHAANTYCRWLSQKTGKTYRLPTAAEWEYATGTNKNEEFFFGGKTSDYTAKNIVLNLFQKPSGEINNYVIWKENSTGKTGLPEKVLPNRYGILNLLGNVREFCLDTIRIDQKTEYLIKGGSFKSSVHELLLNFKDHTQHDKWMITDPQIPKSIWWYSDCNDVGFRVVCEWPQENQINRIK